MQCSQTLSVISSTDWEKNIGAMKLHQHFEFGPAWQDPFSFCQIQLALDTVCVSQFVAERSAILLVLVIKLTKESRRRVWRGRDRDGEIWKGTESRGRV
jgi:hypothetical protein